MSECPWRHQQLSGLWHHMMLWWVSPPQDAVIPNWWCRAGTWSACCVQGLITCCVQGLITCCVQGLITCCVQGLISCVFHSAEEWRAETLHDVFPKSRRGLAAVRGTWMIYGDTNSWLCNCDPVWTGRVHESAGTWTVPARSNTPHEIRCDIILYVQKRSVLSPEASFSPEFHFIHFTLYFTKSVFFSEFRSFSLRSLNLWSLL